MGDNLGYLYVRESPRRPGSYLPSGHDHRRPVPHPIQHVPLHAHNEAALATSATQLTFDSAREPRRGSPARERRPSLLTSWYMEVLWVLVSIGSFAVILAVLSVYDDHALPSLPLNITLNTFVAFFSTISKAAFMISIAEAISQCKWNWYHKERPLSDFETFDEASRGFWGSVYLVGRVRWRNVASLGAFVTILSVFTSPITQQVISYPTRQAIALNAANATTMAATAWGYGPGAGAHSSETDVLKAALHSILSNLDKPLDPVAITCPTGDCAFPQFSSLGLCVKTADITSRLNVTQVEPDPDNWLLISGLANATLAYNVSLTEHCKASTPSTYMFMTCSSHPNTSLAFQDDADLMTSMLYAMPMIYSMGDADTFANRSDPGPVRFGALEVLFHLCVTTYNVSVEGGVAKTEPVASSWKRPANDTSKPLQFDCNEQSEVSVEPLLCNLADGVDPEAERTGWLTLQNPEKPKSMDQADYYRAQRPSLDMIIDNIHYVTNAIYMYDPTDNSDNALSISSGHIQLIEALYDNNGSDFYRAAPLAPEAQVARVGTIMQNIAMGMTNLMREGPAWADGTGDVGAFAVAGQALVTETFVHVRWGWIAFMAAEIALAVVFLALTVAYTWRLDMQVLKSSPLATLQALDEQCRSAVGGITTPAQARSNARTVRVNLAGDAFIMSQGAAKDLERQASQDSLASPATEKGGMSPVVIAKEVAAQETGRPPSFF